MQRNLTVLDAAPIESEDHSAEHWAQTIATALQLLAQQQAAERELTAQAGRVIELAHTYFAAP